MVTLGQNLETIIWEEMPINEKYLRIDESQ
jgi:hypothetical protein